MPQSQFNTPANVSRNHYTRFRTWIDGPNQGKMRKDGKWFQEPYAYQLHYEQHKDQFQGREAEIYRAVLPTCRYLIRLRYSLMQLLYDAMFENMINGLPIARAMVSIYPSSASQPDRCRD